MSAPSNAAAAVDAAAAPLAATQLSDAASTAAAPAASIDASPAAVASASAAAASAEPAAKQWKIADVPEGADPLDYINMEKLKEDNKNMPTTKEGIAAMLNEMPITADVIPGASSTHSLAACWLRCSRAKRGCNCADSFFLFCVLFQTAPT